MNNIHNVTFLRFRDVIKQNGHDTVEILYRESLGEMVVHYDNVYKLEKGLRWGIIEFIWAYFCMHWKFSVCFPVRSHFALLQGFYYFLPLLSNGCMSKTLWTTLFGYTMCCSLFCPHTSVLVLLIVTSLRISFISQNNVII